MRGIASRLARMPVAGLALAGLCQAAGAQDAIPAAVEKLISADKDCIDYDASHMKDAREVARLDANNTLYLLPCYSGAYNLIYRVYVLDTRYPDELKPSAFAGYSDELGWYGKTQLINAYYDRKTKTLTAFEKSRGLGDCGSKPTYEWNGYGWRMVEYRYWGKCDGSRMPQEWPVIYRFSGNSKR